MERFKKLLSISYLHMNNAAALPHHTAMCVCVCVCVCEKHSRKSTMQ